MEDAENLQHLSRLKFKMEDVFIEILLRLPANILQTFKTVCKNWYRIIRSPYFVKLHFNVYNQSRIRILMPKNYYDTMIEYNINGDQSKQILVPYPPVIFKGRFKILGSCGGLLCLFLRRDRKIGVYNPSTGKYFSLQLCPPLSSYCSIDCSWFGRKPSSGEYVLVLVFTRSNLGKLHSEVGIYKFNRSNLELIHSTSCPIPPSSHRRGTLLHGILHWPSYSRVGHPSRDIICAYNLNDNKYSEISPPAQCDYFYKLGVAEGCLLATFKATAASDFELWIMKEYGNEQSWTKYADILGFEKSSFLTPLGCFPNGDLILDVDNCQVIKYCFNDNKAIPLTDPEYNDRHMQEAIICADSLVAPTIVVGEGVQ